MVNSPHKDVAASIVRAQLYMQDMGFFSERGVVPPAVGHTMQYTARKNAHTVVTDRWRWRLECTSSSLSLPALCGAAVKVVAHAHRLCVMVSSFDGDCRDADVWQQPCCTVRQDEEAAVSHYLRNAGPQSLCTCRLVVM
jgi:hypothetical protein